MKKTPEKMIAFCAVLAECCNVGKACKEIGIARGTAYSWREEDEEFAKMWDRAKEIGVSALEDEAHRRGFDGVDEPLTHQGQFTPLYRPRMNFLDEPELDDEGRPIMEPVLDEDGNQRYASIKKYSDTLAIFLLKAHAPEKYRERSEVKLEAGDLANQLRAARERNGDSDK